MSDRHATEPEKQARGRRGEMAQFLILAFGIWPIAAVAFVGGYGFLV